MWMDFIFQLIWMLGVTFSMYETTMNFKSHHAETISMAYKSEGDGLQTYTIRQKGYTYQIFMSNDPVSIFLAKRLSPLDAIVMALFDTVEGKNHQCVMAHIYNSSTYFKAAYNHGEKVPTHGVASK